MFAHRFKLAFNIFRSCKSFVDLMWYWDDWLMEQANLQSVVRNKVNQYYIKTDVMMNWFIDLSSLKIASDFEYSHFDRILFGIFVYTFYWTFYLDTSRNGKAAKYLCAEQCGEIEFWRRKTSLVILAKSYIYDEKTNNNYFKLVSFLSSFVFGSMDELIHFISKQNKTKQKAKLF